MKRLIATALIAVTAASAHAAIVIDYSSTTNSFFNPATTNGAAARAAVERAATDVSAALDLSGLQALTLGQPTQFTASVNGSTFNYNYNPRYSNPDNDAATPFTGSLAQGEIRVFVGARDLNPPTLGMGGPGSFTSSSGGSFFNGNDFAAAAAQVAADAGAALSRGGGPVIFATGFSGNAGGVPYNESFNVGAGIGNLWFDDNAAWTFDHTAPVASNTNDLYSVALHEILHSIGFGASDSWDSMVVDLDGDSVADDWAGASVQAELGTGLDLIEPGHIASNLMSTVIGTTTPQEALMDPTLTTGTRKFLTNLDIAFLEDMGYVSAVVAIPEPSSLAIFAFGIGVLSTRRRRK